MSDDSWKSKYVAMKRLYIDTKRELFKHFGGNDTFYVRFSAGLESDIRGDSVPKSDDGYMLNKKYASTGKKCGEGANIFPTIEWGNLPNGTESLALIVDDPDASKGKPTQIEPWVHLVAWNIDPEYKNLDDATLTNPGMVKTGINSFNNQSYGGPCPPAGDQPHHYRFKLYALNKQKLDLNENATVDDLIAAMNKNEGTILGEASTIGLYGVQTT